MSFNKSGTLIVNTSSANGAIPIPGTLIRIVGSSEENRDVVYSVRTDIDGVSEKLILPAPDRTLSQSPGATSPSYALYDIIISAPGYYTKRVYNVVVFDGEETIQPINMIPRAIHINNATYPRDNLTTFVRENEMLE